MAYCWGWAEEEQRTGFLNPKTTVWFWTHCSPLGSRSPLPWEPQFLTQQQTGFLLQVVRGLSAGARVFEYMSLSPVIPLTGGYSIPSKDLRGSITFQNVSFRSALVGRLRKRTFWAENEGKSAGI